MGRGPRPSIAEARRHAEAAQLLALPLHADRLEGRALLAAGDAEGALVPPRARRRRASQTLGAAWEVALTELALGEAFAALGREDDAAQALSQGRREVFERLRVPRELERARALLGRLPPAP